MIEFFPKKLFFTQAERLAVENRLLQAKKMEAIGRLAGGIAHDLNNVLTVICGYNHLLATQLADHPRLLEYTRELQKATEHGAGLTAQLLAFSRRQPAQSRLLDLNVQISDVGEMLRRIIGDDVQLAIHLAPELKPIQADPVQIDQVLINLAVNARDAMPFGGRLTIETANVELTAAFRQRHIGLEPGLYVMLAISDTGTGMDADTKNRLFEPFFTTKDSDKGTGLGLSIVYGIVKQYSGEIRVYSQPGKGTTMKIYLPVAVAEAAPELVMTAAAGAPA